MKLTIILRDETPLLYTNDPPTHRSVQIELTNKQVEAIGIRWLGRNGTADLYEEVCQCFIEPFSLREPVPGCEDISPDGNRCAISRGHEGRHVGGGTSWDARSIGGEK